MNALHHHQLRQCVVVSPDKEKCCQIARVSFLNSNLRTHLRWAIVQVILRVVRKLRGMAFSPSENCLLGNKSPVEVADFEVCEPSILSKNITMKICESS